MPPKLPTQLKSTPPNPRALVDQPEILRNMLSILSSAFRGKTITNIDVAGSLALQENPTAYVIASGVIDLEEGSGRNTASRSAIAVDTEGAAASDILHTINGGRDGQILLARAYDDTHTVVVESGTGNIILPADMSLESDDQVVILHYNASKDTWLGYPIVPHSHTDAGSGGVLSHNNLTDVTPDQHHSQQHVIAGADHTASGLTVGHVIRATGATTFAWQQLQHGDLGGVGVSDHHAKYTDAEAIAAVEGEPTLDLAGNVSITAGKSLSVDAIGEKTAGTGVTIDQVLLKDGNVYPGNQNTRYVSDNGTDIVLDVGANFLEVDTIGGSSGLRVVSTQDGQLGVNLALRHVSGTPAPADVPAQILFQGKDDGGNNTNYAVIRAVIVDETDLTEDGRLEWLVMQGAVSTLVMRLDEAGALHTYGYLYPGTGSAMQSTHYICDVGAHTKIGGITGGGCGLVIENTCGDVGAAALRLVHLSASPANNDRVGHIYMRAYDDGNNETDYIHIRGTSTVIADGSEDSLLEWLLLDGGGAGLNTAMQLTGDGDLYLDGYVYPGLGPGIQSTAYLEGTAGGQINVVTTVSDRGLQIRCINDGAIGARLSLTQESASPAAGDDIGRINFYGDNSIGTQLTYAAIRAVIDDPTNGTEDSSFKFWGYDAGAWNLAMSLTGAGGLSVDADIGTGDDPVALFDDYDDIALIERLRKHREMEPFVELGILEPKEDGYMLNLRTAHWFTFDAIRQLACRIAEVERRLAWQ